MKWEPLAQSVLADADVNGLIVGSYSTVSLPVKTPIISITSITTWPIRSDAVLGNLGGMARNLACRSIPIVSSLKNTVPRAIQLCMLR